MPPAAGECLAGRTAVIVGGTGGIGSAAARAFAAHGARLVVAGRDDPAGRAIAAELGPALRFVPCDAADEASVDALFAEADAFLGGRLDILYHVAGFSGRRLGDGPLHECSADGWDGTLAGNLRGVFLTNRAALRRMTAQPPDAAGQRGVILNMASVLAFRPAPPHFSTHAYAAAKAGVIGLSTAAAAHYAPLGIRINVIAPGLIETPMSARACGDPAIRAYLTAKQPLAGGPGLPTDCADAAVFLCSPESRLLTGVVLPVDGGRHVL
jgi:NAD(P)-dependent dehydrogenase (short-subunit alcohol dehydrogenase family)